MGINPEFLRSHGHDTFLPGHMTIYIECDIDENKRKELDQRLPTNDAADIEVTKHRGKLIKFCCSLTVIILVHINFRPQCC